MSQIEVVPERLVHKEMLEDFLDWLRAYPAPLRIKKHLLVDWCVQTDTKMQRWMVEYIGAGDI